MYGSFVRSMFVVMKILKPKVFPGVYMWVSLVCTEMCIQITQHASCCCFHSLEGHEGHLKKKREKKKLLIEISFVSCLFDAEVTSLKLPLLMFTVKQGPVLKIICMKH